MFKLIKNYIYKKYEKKILSHPAVQKAFAESEAQMSEWTTKLNNESNKIHYDLAKPSYKTLNDFE